MHAFILVLSRILRRSGERANLLGSRLLMLLERPGPSR